MKLLDWHRLFGLLLTDFFTGTSYTVELEKDLSLKQQLLDVVIIEKREGTPPQELPDGLENMAAHNLISYKSHQESLDGWTLDELTGHYVNYRKQISLPGKLLPEKDFQLYAVSARYPKKQSEEREFKSAGEGVYKVLWGSRHITVIVLSRIRQDEKNALWHLFSAVPENVRYGAVHYRRRMPDMSSVINDLFQKYKTEGVIAMPYTIEDYRRELRQDIIDSLTADEMLKKLSIDERLKGISTEDLLKKISADELLKKLPLDERLKGISAEALEDYLKKLKQNK